MYAIKVTCPKHPRFNPILHSESDIKAGCQFCYDLLDFHVMVKEFNEATKVQRKVPAKR